MQVTLPAAPGAATTRAGARTIPTKEQFAHLASWIDAALVKMPYAAKIILGFRVLDAPGLGTFAVDDRMRLYVDFEAVLPRGHTWCCESLLHEFGHVWNDHSARALEIGVPMEVQPRRDWNIAGDFAINDDLVEAGCLTLSDVLPEHIGQDRHLTAEHYYDVIRKARAARQQDSCTSCGSPTKPDGQSLFPHPQPGQGQPGQGQPGQGQPGQGQPGQGQPGQGQPGQGQPGGECPECGGTVPQFAGCGSGSGGPAAPGEIGSDDLGGYAAPASQTEVEDLLLGTAQDILDHVSKGRGTVPGSMLAQANLMLAPSKVPWQKVLSTNLRRAYGKVSGKTRKTYARRNRRRHNVRFGTSGERVIYPGSVSPKIRVLVVRDTSGSMSASDLNAVGSEIVAIAKSLHIKDEYLQVMDVDARVHAVTPYRSVSSLVEVHGRGGTDMCKGIEAAEKLVPMPDIVVVATDGRTLWPEHASPFPVIACLVGSCAPSAVSSVPSWITSVVIEEAVPA